MPVLPALQVWRPKWETGRNGQVPHAWHAVPAAGNQGNFAWEQGVGPPHLVGWVIMCSTPRAIKPQLCLPKYIIPTELRKKLINLHEIRGYEDNYSDDHKFVQNNAAFLLANLSMSRVNLAVL